MTNFEIGYITKAQGVKGEFRLRPNTRNYENYTHIKKMFFGGKVYNVHHVSLRNGFVVCKVDGIDDRTTVEGLAGTTVYVDAEDFDLPADEYLHTQIIGCNLYSEKGEMLGDITNVDDYGAGEVYYVINPKGKEFMFPNVRGVVQSIDVNAKKVVVDTDILNEIISE